MKISVNEGYFRKKYDGSRRTVEESLMFCKTAGFDAVDMGLGNPKPSENLIHREDYIGEAQKMREYCDKIGIIVDQSHADYDYKRWTHEDFVANMLKTVEVSKILGVENVVVHADTYYDPEFNFDFDTVLNKVYDTYAPMVELAKKLDINIAMENLFEDRAPKGKRARFTSYVDELEAIVNKFNDPNVTICWDFGHARVSYGNEQFEQMKKVGHKITSTHVHDNMANHDLHQFPYLGMTDWKKGLQAMKEIGYKGTLTFELVYGCLPDELQMDYAKFLVKTGRYMVNQIEN